MTDLDGNALISFIVLTLNEEKHIERCLKSILPLSKHIYVIDSYSTDDTVDIAKRNGATVLQNPWINHANQLNWAIKNCKIGTSWIMRLDADEYLTSELRNEIRNTLAGLNEDITGLILKYRHYFWGRWIKHGTRYPLPLLRIWRTGKGFIENKWMDERVVLTEGRTHTLQSDFIHDDLNDLTFFIQKHNAYATREAIDLLNREYHFLDGSKAPIPVVEHNHFNLIIKNRFYSNSFLFFRCFVYFIYRFFFRLGFLDGVEGLVYHFLQGFWYRFLVDAKFHELKNRFENDPEELLGYLKNKYQI